MREVGLSGAGLIRVWYGAGWELGLVKVSIRSRKGLDKVSIRVASGGGKKKLEEVGPAGGGYKKAPTTGRGYYFAGWKIKCVQLL
jgi:hypothetical protein